MGFRPFGLVTAILVATATSGFSLGMMHSRRADAASRATYDAKLEAIRAEVRSEIGTTYSNDAVVPAGMSGRVGPSKTDGRLEPAAAARARMVAEIKRELQS